MLNDEDFVLLTDLYELTMAQGYWTQGKADEIASFTMYFRKNPFNGGYAIACGMASLAVIVQNFRFTQSQLEYLASLRAADNSLLIKPDFLKYLKDLKLSVNIDAVKEGSVVFANDILVRVTGPLLECQILETVLLNCINFQTLIATKASRVSMQAHPSSVAEFGLRRAQGPSGGLWASRASIVGGCVSTSNVLAGQKYGVKVTGTHAHSWIMSFDDEITAFREYAKAMPNNCIFLVDTYDVEQGMKNAITVGLEMKARGEKLIGIRIDSGDLAWLSIKARKMLDEAGFHDCTITASNDLDEYTVKSLKEQGARIDAYGVGTKLACAADQPSLGGVYKLNAIRDSGNGSWKPCLKLSSQSSKLTVPGVLGTKRFVSSDGKFQGDMIYDVNAACTNVIIDPHDSLSHKDLSGLYSYDILEPLVVNGQSVLSDTDACVITSAKRAKEQLEFLDPTCKRLLNAHKYPVGLDSKLFQHRLDIIEKLQNK